MASGIWAEPVQAAGRPVNIWIIPPLQSFRAGIRRPGGEPPGTTDAAGGRHERGAPSGDTGLVIPDGPGTYALALWCGGSRQSVRIGRLGVLPLRPGWYIYVGSAFGPGGLRARIGHHRRVARRPHWHVDYLRRRTRLVAVWYISRVRCEHEWAQRLGAIPGAAMPLAGFGSSDCRCTAHLLQFDEGEPTHDPSATDSHYYQRPR
jgi:Uri superfamily endonuclease